MNKENPQILNAFLKSLLIKNYSKGTIAGYKFDLLIFFNFIINYFKLNIKIRDINVFILSKVKRQDIVSFIFYLCDNKENCFNTRLRKLSSIKTFYNWLFIKYPTLNQKENPTSFLPYIEPTERLPKYLQLEHAKKIQNIFNISNSKYYVRDNAIISLFLYTGMRLSELANIKIKDIDFENKHIKIIGKGNKERFVFLNDQGIKIIKKYLATRKIIDMDSSLFVNNKNNRLSNRSIQVICTKAFQLAGLEDYGYTTHTLRHTFATYVYKQTKDILVVKELLRHERIDTTMIYTHLENEELRKAVNSNPLNNFITEKKAGEGGIR